MILDLSTFNFDQWSWVYLALSSLMVVRERRVVPFVLCLFGSFVQSWLGLFLIAAVSLLDRLYTQKSKWLVFVQGVGLVSMFMAWHAPEVIRDYYLVFGVFCHSFHFRFGRLGVVVPLLMAHAYVPQFSRVELTLGAAGFYLLLEESLRLSKSKHNETIMKWVELPVVVMLLLPLYSVLEGLSLEPEVLVPFASLASLMTVAGTLLALKKVSFHHVAERVRSRGARVYKWTHRGFSERRNWIKESDWSMDVGERTQDFVFWGVVLTVIIWTSLILLSRGAMS